MTTTHKRKRAPTPTTEKSKKRCIQPFEWLPAEMVSEILSHLPRSLDPVLSLVCRNWHQLLPQRARPARMAFTIKWAVQNDCWSLLKWIICRRRHDTWACPCGDAAAFYCLIHGKKKMLGWLLDSEEVKYHLGRAIEIDFQKMVALLMAGRGDMLELVKDRYCGNLYTTFLYAAYRGGSSDCIAWAREKLPNYAMNPKEAMLQAAYGGQFDLLCKTAIQHHQRPTTAMAIAAIRQRRVSVLEWIIEHGSGLDRKQLYAAAFRSGRADLINPVVLRLPLNARSRRYVQKMGIAQWAITHRRYNTLNLLIRYKVLHVDASTVAAAIQQDGHDVRMCKYLLEYAPKMFTKDGLERLKKQGLPPGMEGTLRRVISL